MGVTDLLAVAICREERDMEQAELRFRARTLPPVHSRVGVGRLEKLIVVRSSTAPNVVSLRSAGVLRSRAISLVTCSAHPVCVVSQSRSFSACFRTRPNSSANGPSAVSNGRCKSARSARRRSC